MRFLGFSVYDVKSDTYSPPFWKPTVGMAIRDFSDVAQDERTSIGKHPEDYKLVQVGEFDDVTGTFIQGSQLVSLGFASDHIVKRTVVPLGEVANG